MCAGHGGNLPRDGISPSISRAAAVINPISGAGLAGHAALSRTAFLREALERRGIAGTIHVTTGAGHARELASAAAAAGADLVIVWGGDGTVNEAGSGLAGSHTALGLIPAGSGNGLAASLGVPRDPIAALEHMFSMPERSIDVGYLAERPFFNIAGIGLDAHIAARFNLRERGRRGRWPYVRIGVHEGWRYRALEYDVDVDGRTRRVSALLIAFANGREYGMGACISPGAELDDGLLEAIIVEDRPPLARFVDARHLALRSMARAARVQIAPVHSATVSTAEPGGVMQYHVDGEPGTASGAIHVRIEPMALRVRA
jgi:YegS/Rv2252/BmrU family lipid kinase